MNKMELKIGAFKDNWLFKRGDQQHTCNCACNLKKDKTNGNI